METIGYTYQNNNMGNKMKRSLYFTKTFFFSFLLYLSVVYSPIVNYVYDGKMTKDDFTALIVGTFSFLGVSQGRLRVNDDIRESAATGREVGILSTKVVPTQSKA